MCTAMLRSPLANKILLTVLVDLINLVISVRIQYAVKVIELGSCCDEVDNVLDQSDGRNVSSSCVLVKFCRIANDCVSSTLQRGFWLRTTIV